MASRGSGRASPPWWRSAVPLFGISLKTVPFGTAYAMWTGIGAAGNDGDRHGPVRGCAARPPRRSLPEWSGLSLFPDISRSPSPQPVRAAFSYSPARSPDIECAVEDVRGQSGEMSMSLRAGSIGLLAVRLIAANSVSWSQAARTIRIHFGRLRHHLSPVPRSGRADRQDQRSDPDRRKQAGAAGVDHRGRDGGARHARRRCWSIPMAW